MTGVQTCALPISSKTPSLHYTSEAFPNPGFKFYKRGEPKARRVTSRFPHDVNELTRDKVNSRECGAWLFPFRARLNKLIPSPAPTNWDQCVFTDRKLGHNSFWPNPSLGKMSLHTTAHIFWTLVRSGNLNAVVRFLVPPRGIYRLGHLAIIHLIGDIRPPSMNLMGARPYL